MRPWQHLSTQEELRHQVENEYAREAHHEGVLQHHIEDMPEEGSDPFNNQTLVGLHDDQLLDDEYEDY